MARVHPRARHILTRSPRERKTFPPSTPPKPLTMAPKKAPKATKKITKSPKKAAKKAKVDKKDKPKRAPGPYMIFCKAERPKIVAANPKFSFGEVGKALGEKWRGMSDAQKAKYK